MMKSGFFLASRTVLFYQIWKTRCQWEHLRCVLVENADTFLLSSKSLNSVPNSFFF